MSARESKRAASAEPAAEAAEPEVSALALSKQVEALHQGGQGKHTYGLCSVLLCLTPRKVHAGGKMQLTSSLKAGANTVVTATGNTTDGDVTGSQAKKPDQAHHQRSACRPSIVSQQQLAQLAGELHELDV